MAGRFGPNENAYDAYVWASASRYKPAGWSVPTFAAWVKSHIAAESNPPFNWQSYRAEPGGNASIGLMQVLKSNAPDLSEAELYDPATNIDRGTQIIADNWSRSRGDMDAAISAYNGGWRANAAMGVRASAPLTVCLARDPAGNCIQTRAVAVGEFGNQPYVDRIKSYFAYFVRNPISAPVTTEPPSQLGPGSTTSGPPPLRGGAPQPVTVSPVAVAGAGIGVGALVVAYVVAKALGWLK